MIMPIGPSDIHVDGGRSNGGSDLGDSLLTAENSLIGRFNSLLGLK